MVMNDHSRYSSVTNMLDKLGWTDLAQCCREIKLTFLFNIVQGTVAVPADNYITPNSTRSKKANSLKFSTIRCDTELYRNSFFPRAIIDWNALPEDIVTSFTTTAFKEGTWNQFDKHRAPFPQSMILNQGEALYCTRSRFRTFATTAEALLCDDQLKTLQCDVRSE